MSEIKYTGESFLQQGSSKTGQMSQLQDESTSPSSRLHPAYSTGETGLSQRRTSANHRTDPVTLLLQFLKAKYCGSPVPGWTGLRWEWSSVLTETRNRVSLAQSDWHFSKDCFHFLRYQSALRSSHRLSLINQKQIQTITQTYQDQLGNFLTFCTEIISVSI